MDSKRKKKIEKLIKNSKARSILTNKVRAFWKRPTLWFWKTKH